MKENYIDYDNRCPCYKELCKDCPMGFEKVVDLKNTGLVIYRYAMKPEKDNPNIGVGGSDVEIAGNGFIFHNTKDADIKSQDFLPEMEKRTLKCTRCRQIVKHAVRILQKVSAISKYEIIGICEHCKLNEYPCCECEDALKKFSESKKEAKDFLLTKERVRKWLSNVQSEFKVFIEKKPGREYLKEYIEKYKDTDRKQLRARSEVRFDQLCRQGQARNERELEIKELCHQSKEKILARPSLNSINDISKKQVIFNFNDQLDYVDSVSAISLDRQTKSALEISKQVSKLNEDQIYPSIISKKDKGNKEIHPSLPGTQGHDYYDDGIISVRHPTQYAHDKKKQKFSREDDIDEIGQTDFIFSFPFETKKEETYKQQKSSSELISDIHNIIREKNEEIIRKNEEYRLKKYEEEERKRRARQEKIKLAEEKKLLDEEKMLMKKKEQKFHKDAGLFDKSKDIVSIKDKTSKTAFIPTSYKIKQSKSEVDEKESDSKFKSEMKGKKNKSETKHKSMLDESSKRPKYDLSSTKTEQKTRKGEPTLKSKHYKSEIEADSRRLKAETKVDSQQHKIELKGSKADSKEPKPESKQPRAEINAELKQPKAESKQQDTELKSKLHLLQDPSELNKSPMPPTSTTFEPPNHTDQWKELKAESKKSKAESKGFKPDSKAKSKHFKDEPKVSKAESKETRAELKQTKPETKDSKFKSDFKTSPDSKTIKEERREKEKNDKDDIFKIGKAAEMSKKEKDILTTQKKTETIMPKDADESVIKYGKDIKMRSADEPRIPRRQLEAQLAAKEQEKYPKKLKKESKAAATEEEKRITQKKEFDLNQIKMLQPSQNLMVLNLVKVKESAKRTLSQIMTPSQMRIHEMEHKVIKVQACPMCINSNLELEYESRKKRMIEEQEMIKGREIRCLPAYTEEKQDQGIKPVLFHLKYDDKFIADIIEPPKHIPIVREYPEESKPTKALPEEESKGVIRYALSDRTFIEKGWTILPTEKVVRKMNVYRMRPAHPEFDWFERNKNKRFMKYATGERLAEFDDDGRGRWYYKNQRLALQYYDAEELNAQQRFVIYSNGEPDERGRARPYTVLAMFDYLGNGIVFDHGGKLRMKYNQTEGVVLDRNIGPVSHWKWHTLNDPPVLQQVMIDTQMSYKDPDILKMATPHDKLPRPDNEEMLAIEFDNFIKEKSKKLSQKFKPFQIRMKALKINEHFSLKVLDQANVYLIYRDGTTNIKLNLGMLLDHKEIVDTDTAEVGEVASNMERLPARTDSLAGMQKSVARAQRFERTRTERERRLRPPEPSVSADKLTAAITRPLRPPAPLCAAYSSTATPSSYCKSRKPSSHNIYHDNRLF